MVRVRDPDEEFEEIEGEESQTAMTMVPADNSFGFVYTNDKTGRRRCASREWHRHDRRGPRTQKTKTMKMPSHLEPHSNPPPPQQVDSTIAIIRKLELEDAGDALSDMRPEVAAAVLQRLNPQKAACAAAMMSPTELSAAVVMMTEESVLSVLNDAPPAATCVYHRIFTTRCCGTSDEWYGCPRRFLMRQ